MNLIAHLPRFRALEDELSVLAAREVWSRRRIDDHRLGMLNALWTAARAQVPYYRELSATHGLPASFGSLEEFATAVPLLDKQVVRHRPDAFLSERPDGGRWHRTGGSTGIPMRVYWSDAAHRRSLRVKYRAEQARGVGVFDRKTFLWGHGASLAPGWRGRVARLRRPVEDRLRSRLRLSAYRLGPDDLHGYLLAMRRFRPAALYGYSSAVFLLAREARARGITVPSLRLVTLSAEPAHRWIVDEVEAAFGAPVLVEYGSVECGVMATSDDAGRLRIREDHVLLEAVPRPDGTREIVVTVLHNPSFPLIRYRIGDLTPDSPVQPDDGFGYLTEVTGRDNDFVFTRDGRPVHPLAVKHVVEHHEAVRRFTARQGTDGRLTLSLETDGALAPDAVAQLTSQLASLVDGYPVAVDTVDSLPGTAAGKHRWVVSEMTPPAGAP